MKHIVEFILSWSICFILIMLTVGILAAIVFTLEKVQDNPVLFILVIAGIISFIKAVIVMRDKSQWQ